MAELLTRTLPLAVGAAVSPLVLAISVALLSGRTRPMARAAAFGAGAAVPIVIVAGAGMVVRLPSVGEWIGALEDGPLTASAGIDIAAGIVLMLVGGRLVIRRPTATERRAAGLGSPGRPEASPLRFFLGGLGIMLTNVSTLALFVPASKDVAIAPVSLFAQVVVLFLLAAIVLIPVWVPIAAYALAPGSAARILGRAAMAVREHAREVTAAVVVALGVYLVVRGILVL
jgi:hypothetical protein